MDTTIQIYPASINDASVIVEIFRQSFSPSLLNCMIYGCAGITKYVMGQIAAPRDIIDTFFGIAKLNQSILGCIELRLSTDTIFLNYIAVRPEARGKGIGTQLLKRSIEMVAQSFHRVMQLDVFEDNYAIKAWYERLGFQPLSRKNWWRGEMLNFVHSSPLAFLSGYPQAEICQKEFGFSQFQLKTSKEEYMVGRISDQWFRLTQTSAFEDSMVLSTLSRLDNQRHILAILPKEANIHLPDTSQHLTGTCRMTISLDELKSKLG